MTKRVVFFAAHLLSRSVGSGGDILFCEQAARLKKIRPEWEIIALAPDFARADLEHYFDNVVAIRTPQGEAEQGTPAKVALTWLGRLTDASNALATLKPDLVHSTGDFFIDVWPVVAARGKHALKWSGVVHHINAPPLKRMNSPVVASVSYALQRGSFLALRSADAISVLNHGVKNDLERLHFKGERLHVVGAGIELERFPLIPAGGQTRRAVWVNRLEPTKGLFDLPDIVKRLPDDVAVDVVGRGPEVHVERLRRALRKAGVEERCVLHGFIPTEDLQRILEQAGVFISCSYEEGWGISIAEALAMGLPCIAYDLPSHREIFGDEIRRVELGDKAAFADAIVAALRENGSNEQRSARRAAAARHGIDACARRQEQVFASLIA